MSLIRHHQPLGLRAWEGCPHGMRDAHCHFDLELNYVLDGAMTYLIDGVRVTLPQRRLCVLWGAVPHQTLLHSEATQAIWVTVSLNEVLGWNLPEWFIERLFGQGLLVDKDDGPADLHVLRRWVHDLQADQKSGDKSAIVLMELEARLRRMTSNFAHHTLPTAQPTYEKIQPNNDGADMVETLARFVTAHYRQEITVAQIAAAAHLHPNYAMTLFRRQTGMTLNQYLTSQRVAHAQRLLATTRRPITDIAYDSGFGSISRFYEAFRQQTGCSPRRFRLRLA